MPDFATPSAHFFIGSKIYKHIHARVAPATGTVDDESGSGPPQLVKALAQANAATAPQIAFLTAKASAKLPRSSTSRWQKRGGSEKLA